MCKNFGITAWLPCLDNYHYKRVEMIWIKACNILFLRKSQFKNGHDYRYLHPLQNKINITYQI